MDQLYSFIEHKLPEYFEEDEDDEIVIKDEHIEVAKSNLVLDGLLKSYVTSLCHKYSKDGRHLKFV